MPTEERLPVARQAFQPSRSRLLQPSELFWKSHPDASEQPQAQSPDGASASHPPPQNNESEAQVPLRAKGQLNPPSRYQTPLKKQNDPTLPDPESEPIPRIPRISSKASSSLSKQMPGFAKTVTPFVLNKAPNKQRVAPLLSRSQIKSHSFPLRSSNQLALKSPNQHSLLKSRNQTSIPAASRSAQPQVLNQTVTSTTQATSHRSSEPVVVKASSVSAVPAPVAPASPSRNVTESRHSQESIITIQNTARPPVTADASVQPSSLSFPLSTLPPHVLQAMSQKERDGFTAGWSAGWAACVQSMHNGQNDTTVLVRSSTSGEVASAQRTLSPVGKQQCSPSPGPASIPPTSPDGPPQTNSPVISGASPRRRLSDPYENDGPHRDPNSLVANKRPRTSPITHPKVHARPSRQESSAPQPAPSPAEVRNSGSTSNMKVPSQPTLHAQHCHPESHQRISGQDAYLARESLGDMRSVDDAFASARTQDPVDFHRKKRKRSEKENAGNARQPTEGKAMHDPRRQIQTGSQSDPSRGDETRILRDPTLPAPAGSRQDPWMPGWTIREDTRQQRQGKSIPDPRQAAEGASRRDPICSTGTKNQQESEPQTETRSGQESGHLTGVKAYQQPRWLGSENGTPSSRSRVSVLPPGNFALHQTENGGGVTRVTTTNGVKSHTDQRHRPGRSSVNCPPTTTGKMIQSSPPLNCLPTRLGRTEGLNQSLSQQSKMDNARPDIDIHALDSQEESGWGTALNAATSRERFPLGSRDTSGRLDPAKVSTPNGTSQQPSRVSGRDPRRRQQSTPNIETAEKNAISGLAEKERDDITVQAYAERFGLVIVERNHESGKVEWVACKFCPVFGCRTRDPDYIMAHRAPFYAKKFVAHLEKDHCVKWKEYTQSNAKEKVQFFSGKALPAKAFRDRVAELKRTQDGIARRPVPPVITAEAENALIDKAVEKLTKKQAPINSTTMVLNRTDECWIGRNRFRDQNSMMDISVSRSHTPAFDMKGLPRLQRISECIKELEINSDLAGLILHGVMKSTDIDEEAVNCNSGFTDTIIIDGDEMRPTTILFANVDKAMASRVAVALQYMYYGIPGSTCMALWQDNPEVQDDGSRSGDNRRDVFGHGNAIMGLGMHLVSRALKLNWAMGLKTRSCRYVSGKAVEVLVSVRDDGGAVRRVHLVTVQNMDGAGEAVTEVLGVIFPCWKEQLIGVHSGICKQKEKEEKRVEVAILEEVRKACGRELVVVEHGVCLEEKPMFPWTLSKMCDSKFNSTLSSIEMPLGFALGKARLEAAKAQRKELSSRVIRGRDEQEVFQESWKVAGERAAEIYVVAEGLLTVWMCDCAEDRKVVKRGHRRDKGTVVECDAERVLWARGLVDMWKWCKKVANDLGMESPS